MPVPVGVVLLEVENVTARCAPPWLRTPRVALRLCNRRNDMVMKSRVRHSHTATDARVRRRRQRCSGTHSAGQLSTQRSKLLNRAEGKAFN